MNAIQNYHPADEDKASFEASVTAWARQVREALEAQERRDLVWKALADALDNDTPEAWDFYSDRHKEVYGWRPLLGCKYYR